MANAATARIVSAAMPDGTQEQTIITAALGVNQVLHRIYTQGQRGRGSAWHLRTTDSVTNRASLLAETLTMTAVFTLTDKDVHALRAGVFTSAGVKAAAALAESGIGANTVPASLIALGIEEANTETIVPAPIAAAAPIAAVVTEPRKPAAAPVELATVPDIKWADQYINRKVIGDLTEFDIYDQAMRDNANVLIRGHAGSGKTMSVLAYAAARGLRFYSVSAHAGIEVSEVFGRWNPTGDPQEPFAWVDGGWTECFRNGNAVILLNEINFLPERFTTVIFSALDARREFTLMGKDGEVVRAGENLLIIGDMNPNYRGTRQMNQAWADRFSQHTIEFPYDAAIEAKLIPNKGLRELATQLRARFDREELSTPVSTRSLVGFSKNLATLGYEYASYVYLNTFADSAERNAVSLVLEAHKSAIQEG